jgi:hypothetical protein
MLSEFVPTNYNNNLVKMNPRCDCLSPSLQSIYTIPYGLKLKIWLAPRGLGHSHVVVLQGGAENARGRIRSGGAGVPAALPPSPLSSVEAIYRRLATAAPARWPVGMRLRRSPGKLQKTPCSPPANVHTTSVPPWQ